MALVTASMRRPASSLKGILDAVGNGARGDRHLAGDFFGGKALSHPQQCFELTGRGTMRAASVPATPD
jgi:hypothetical protein